MMRGSCNCEGVSFEVDAAAADIYVCHCSICRRSTGNNGVAVIVIDNSQFRWTAGEALISRWDKPDADWQCWFCRVCGSSLPGKNDESRMFVPAGLLSDATGNLEVKHHIWVDSKADWDQIGDTGRVHPQSLEP